MACLRLFTFRRPPDFNSPCLYSRITLPIFFEAFFPYLRPELLRLDVESDELRELLLCPLDLRLDADFVAR